MQQKRNATLVTFDLDPITVILDNICTSTSEGEDRIVNLIISILHRSVNMIQLPKNYYCIMYNDTKLIYSTANLCTVSNFVVSEVCHYLVAKQ